MMTRAVVSSRRSFFTFPAAATAAVVAAVRVDISMEVARVVRGDEVPLPEQESGLFVSREV